MTKRFIEKKIIFEFLAVISMVFCLTGCAESQTYISGESSTENREEQIGSESQTEAPRAEWQKFAPTDIVSWTVPYNTERENGITYISGSGDWNRPLGLYSFAATADILFLEDSANHRIAVYKKDETVDYIEMPEKMICEDMGYDAENNVLYLLLFDNLAVEPATYTYCKVMLNESLELIIIEEIPISTRETEVSDDGQKDYYSLDADLDSTGQPITVRTFPEHQMLKEEIEKLEISKQIDGNTIDFYTQCDDISLYAYYDISAGDYMLLFLVQDGKIIAYSDVLFVGEFLSPTSVCAYMYEKENLFHIVYLTQSQNDELSVVQAEFTSIVE